MWTSYSKNLVLLVCLNNQGLVITDMFLCRNKQNQLFFKCSHIYYIHLFSDTLLIGLKCVSLEKYMLFHFFIGVSFDTFSDYV